MKILLYTPENLETIASETGTYLDVVTKDYEDSIRLSLSIYSVIGFIHFATDVINPGVTFVIKSIIDDHYKRTEPEKPQQYTEVVVKYNRSKS